MMIVDDRTGSVELLRPLKRAGVPVKSGRLPFADFAFYSADGYHDGGPVHVGVERKKISEMLGAIQDSRFRRRQVGGLLNTYGSHAWLLVEGAYEPNDEGILYSGKAFTSKRGQRMIVFYEGGFTRERHLYENQAKFQITLQAKARLQYMRTVSEEETVAWLACLYRWYQKRFDDHKSVYVVDETKPEEAILSADTLQRRVIAQLPGVGWTRSLDVVRYMKQNRLSLGQMFDANRLQWKEALNFKEGKTIARRVHDSIWSRDDVK